MLQVSLSGWATSLNASQQVSSPRTQARSSSREVRIRVPLFLWSILGEPSQPKKKRVEKGHLARGPSRDSEAASIVSNAQVGAEVFPPKCHGWKNQEATPLPVVVSFGTAKMGGS